MKNVSILIVFGAVVLLGLGELKGQHQVQLSIRTELPISVAWGNDVLGLNYSDVVVSPQDTLFKTEAPDNGENGTARLGVQVGHMAKIYLIRPGFTYYITAGDTAVELHSDDPYHPAYEGARDIVGSYTLYKTSDDSLLYRFREIGARLDSIKMAHPGDAILHASLDYFSALRSISPLVQSYRSPATIDYYKKLESELIQGRPILYESPLYWTFLENYYTWKCNIKAFSEFDSPRDMAYLDRFLGEIGLLGNDTVAQIAVLSKINSSYKGEGSKNAEAYAALLDEIALNPLHPAIAMQAGYIQARLEALSVGRAVPDFQVLSTTGDTLALSNFSGKSMVLLDFWFVGCSPCKRDIPTLKSLYADFAERLEIVAVNPLEPLEKVISYRETHHIPYTMGIPADPDGMKREFNVRAYPNYVLIDTDGIVALYAGSDLKVVRTYLENHSFGPDRKPLND